MSEPSASATLPALRAPSVLRLRRAAAWGHLGLVAGVALALARGAASPARCALVLLLSSIVVGALHLLADHHLARRVERAGARARAATRAAESRVELVTTMSHEVRTAMNAIFGFTEMLASDPHLDEQGRGLVGRVRAAARIALSLVDDALSVARAEAGAGSPSRSDFDPGALVASVVDLFAPLATAGGVRLSCRVAPDLPAAVVGDPEQVRQVITNLVANAVRFTERGGIEVELAVAGRGREDVVLRATVRDTGPGIPPGRQSEIFRPFAPASATGPRPGTGLGLSIARRIAERMGGSIALESEPGRGSTFVALLPFEVGRMPDAPVPPAAIARDGMPPSPVA